MNKTKYDAFSDVWHYKACIFGTPDGEDDYLNECDCEELDDVDGEETDGN